MSKDFSQAARACGLKVAIGVPSIVGLLAVIGKAIEQREALGNALSAAWAALLWGLALGGHLWGAVAVGGAALGVLAWVCCVASQLPEKGEEKAKSALLLAGAIAVAFWLLANLAMQTTFADFPALTVYQQIAVVVMHAPYVIGGLTLLIGFAAVMGEAAH